MHLLEKKIAYGIMSCLLNKLKKKIMLKTRKKGQGKKQKKTLTKS